MSSNSSSSSSMTTTSVADALRHTVQDYDQKKMLDLLGIEHSNEQAAKLTTLLLKAESQGERLRTISGDLGDGFDFNAGQLDDIKEKLEKNRKLVEELAVRSKRTDEMLGKLLSTETYVREQQMANNKDHQAHTAAENQRIEALLQQVIQDLKQDRVERDQLGDRLSKLIDEQIAQQISSSSSMATTTQDRHTTERSTDSTTIVTESTTRSEGFPSPIAAARDGYSHAESSARAAEMLEESDMAPIKPPYLRSYQHEAVLAAVDKRENTIIVLPTNSGKTRVAAEIIRKVGHPALFIVPTNLLVIQQAEALRHFFKEVVQIRGIKVSELSGNTSSPPWKTTPHGEQLDFHVLVATPEKFLGDYGLKGIATSSGEENLMTTARTLFSKISVVIFDEVHHTLGSAPYAEIAKLIFPAQMTTPVSTPQIVGLTAHPTYKKTELQIQHSIQDLFLRLCITKFFTASDEELKAAGHAPGWGKPLGTSFDSYFEFQKKKSIHGDQSSSFRSIWENPKPNARVETYISYGLRRENTTTSSSAGEERTGEAAVTLVHREFVQLIRDLEDFFLDFVWQVLGEGEETPCKPFIPRVFENPKQIEETIAGGLNSSEELATARDDDCPFSIKKWGKLINKATSTAELRPLTVLEHWYEALRLAAVGGPDAIDLSMHYLTMKHPANGGGVGYTGPVCQSTEKALEDILMMDAKLEEDRGVLEKVGELTNQLKSFRHQFVDSNDRPRLEHLWRVVMREAEEAAAEDPNSSRGDFKAIVFVENKLTTEIVADYLNNTKPLQIPAGERQTIYSAPIYSTQGQATPTYSMTKTRQDAALSDFKGTAFNARHRQSMLLVSTPVIEEGVDVPDARLVIRFDAVLNTVSHVQAGGRARDPRFGKEITLVNATEDLAAAAVAGRKAAQDYLCTGTTAPSQQMSAWISRKERLDSGFSINNLEKCFPIPNSATVRDDETAEDVTADFRVETDLVTKLRPQLFASNGKTPMKYADEQQQKKLLKVSDRTIGKSTSVKATVLVTMILPLQKVAEGSDELTKWTKTAIATSEGEIVDPPKYPKGRSDAQHHEQCAKQAAVNKILQEMWGIKAWSLELAANYPSLK